MSGKFPSRPDFEIPSALIDEHEWMADALIDGPLGTDCTLTYPDSTTECPNCLFDPSTGRSANVYKAGGPYPFPTGTQCPYCGGLGKGTQPVTAPIRLRVYFGGMEVNAAMRQFQALFGSKFAGAADGLVYVIGYMTDIKEFTRAVAIVVNNGVNKPELRCERESEAQPWGFRKNRYFACVLKRS